MGKAGGLGLALILTIAASVQGASPIADAGLPRYAADPLTIEINGNHVPVNDYVVLDGTGSYDPDNSAPLSYQWQQLSGPSVDIACEDIPTFAISGFTQTSEIQRCEFELIVSDGECNSLPDTVEVIIVRAPGGVSNMVLENDSGVLDRNKPTTIYFAGTGDSWSEGDWDDTEWRGMTAGRADVDGWRALPSRRWRG
ncbi:MAG: PKD domain-containing protein [Planctomycetota bacterium]|jgi:hypothetical protein